MRYKSFMPCGYFGKLMAKIGYFRVAVTWLMLLILMIVYLRFYNRPLKFQFTTGIDIGDTSDYCNTPHLVYGDESETLPGYQLIQVQALIRHGDRAPVDLVALGKENRVSISCFFNESAHQDKLNLLGKFKEIIKKDVFKIKGSVKTSLLNEKECSAGQLTPFGYLQHMFNGKHIMEVYREFLQNVNLDTDLLIQSTDVYRTIQSASAIITGMFYSQLRHYDSTKLNINVVHDNHDAHMMLDETGNIIKCPVLKEKSKSIMETKEMLSFKSNVKSMIVTIAQYLRIDFQDMPPFNRIVDVFFIKSCHHQGVPHDPKTMVPLPKSLIKQALSFAHIYTNVLHTPVAELQVLSLLSQIALQSLNSILNEEKYKKFVLYSGHDSMITPMLQVLENRKEKWPPYASRIMIEFFRARNTGRETIKQKIKATYFRIIYNGAAMQNIKFCRNQQSENGLCPLNDLFRYVSDGVYVDSMEAIDPATFHKLLFSRIKNLCRK